MKKDMFVYIEDILESMNLIGEYIKDIDFKKFSGDSEIQDAVMRRFEVIGEAAARLTDEFKDKSSNIPWRTIIGLRNIIIHDYSSVNLKVIWKIAFEDLPRTKKQIEKLCLTT